MQFFRVLERLQDAVGDFEPRGIPREKVLVSRADLRELLRQFERLDEDAREQHRKDNPELYR